MAAAGHGCAALLFGERERELGPNRASLVLLQHIVEVNSHLTD